MIPVGRIVQPREDDPQGRKFSRGQVGQRTPE